MQLLVIEADQFNFGFSIWWQSGDFLNAEDPAFFVEVRTYRERKSVSSKAGLLGVPAFWQVCLRFVNFAYLPLGKQLLVAASRTRLGGKQQNTGCLSIQAVDGRQIVVPKRFSQANQCAVAYIHFRGRGGQEMWFVDHQQVIILVQDPRFEWNVRLIWEISVKPDRPNVIYRFISTDGPTVGIDNLAEFEPVKNAPRLGILEAGDEVFAHTCCAAGSWEVQSGGVDSRSWRQGRGLGHAPIVPHVAGATYLAVSGVGVGTMAPWVKRAKMKAWKHISVWPTSRK